jgi:hypothetical protein
VDGIGSGEGPGGRRHDGNDGDERGDEDDPLACAAARPDGGGNVSRFGQLECRNRERGFL